MNSFLFSLYRFVLSPLAWLIFQIGGLFGGKKWRALVSAKNSRTFHFGARNEEDVRRARPFWIHAASGEIEYARPLIRGLKRRFPDVPIVVTYSSPSAVPILQRLSDVDAWGAVPWEFAGSMNRFLDRFQPRALFVARTDLWPMMADAVERRRLPALLFAATFAAGSSRLRRPARALTQRSLLSLSEIHVVSDDDVRLLAGLVPADRVKVAGDTRFEQVLDRLRNPSPLPDVSAPARRPVLVAGSTWPEDEAVLIPTLARSPDWNLLIAPHELSERRLTALEAQLGQAGLSCQRLSAGGPWAKRVMIVDRMGLLAELYTWGDLAFVGGSFRRQVHSVMEPLAAGLRVVVGPFHKNNREAIQFHETFVDGLSVVFIAKSVIAFSEILSEPAALKGREEIRALVEARQGATERAITWAASVTR